MLIFRGSNIGDSVTSAVEKSFIHAQDLPQDTQESMIGLTKIQDEIDASVSQDKKDTIAGRLALRAQEVEKVIDDSVDALQDTQEFYQALERPRLSSTRQLSLIADLYSASNNHDLLPLLFQLSLDLRKFDDALRYLQMIKQLELESYQEDVHQYLYALFNGVEKIDFGTLNRFKRIVDNYVLDETLTEIDRSFYYSLVTFVRGDLPNYEIFANQLSNTKYAQWQSWYSEANLRYSAFVEAPEYYLRGLINI